MHTYHHRMKQSVLRLLKRQSHSMNRDDCEFATALGQLLSDALILQRHFPVKIPIECIHRRTTCVATEIRICVENRAQPENQAPANDKGKASFYQ